ncbi:MAG: CHAT domain-containing protein [Bacteroidetes bacterium]|nr:MAG: CHAT domain-containing protein [Bacteroidota bacterium]
MDLASTIRNLIAQDKIKQAFDHLLAPDSGLDADQRNSIVLLSGRFKSVKDRENMGILDFSQSRVERAQITAALLSITSSLTEAQEPVVQTPKSAPGAAAYRILFLAANPKDSGRLRLDLELREIEESIVRSRYRDNYAIEKRFAVRPIDLSRAMLEVEPQIIHFSGHGVSLKNDAAGASDRALFWEAEDSSIDDNARGGIALEGPDGNTHIVKDQDLAGLFRLFSDKIQCVLLNACYSYNQAKALIEYVPYVIGMNTAVPDDTAIAFATSFYDALGAGKGIEFAFEFAKSSINLNGLSGAQIPQLMKKG